MRGSARRAVAALAPLTALVLGVPLAMAQDPPLPDFYWPYGNVQADGANLQPEEQPIVAVVRGQACGSAETFLAPVSPDTPPEDVGKTVYVVNVLADGPGAGQRPGCGRAGDAVVFYFPLISRFAATTATFQQGEQRQDLTLGPVLTNHLRLPHISDDGPLE